MIYHMRIVDQSPEIRRLSLYEVYFHNILELIQ